MSKKNLLKIIALLVLVAWYGFFLLHRIENTQGDLGRHITNGQVIVSAIAHGDGGAWHKVLHTNFYSHTFPDFPFVNHHWGSGVIFYALSSTTGYAGLTMFFFVVSLTTLALVFDIARRRANFWSIWAVAWFLIPLLAERNEVRPEIFSYLFFALLWWLLLRVEEKSLSWKWLALIPLIQIIWVNTHIYFPLGIGIVGLFFLSALLYIRQDKPHALVLLKQFGVTLAVTILATLINPFGWRGATYPFHIFENFGLTIRENLPIFALSQMFPDYPNFLLYKIAAVVILLLVVWAWWRKKYIFSKRNLLLAAGSGLAAWRAARNMTLFGFTAIPMLSELVSKQWQTWTAQIHSRRSLNYGGVGVVIIITFFIIRGRLPVIWHTFGLGPVVSSTAAHFLVQSGLTGPLFNDFDSGGFIIEGAFPAVKPFVDNRPEAYPREFSASVYRPILYDEKIWHEQLSRYNFNAILFSYTNFSTTTIPFILRRLQDQAWAPVFTDRYSIVFARHHQQNEAIIKKYEIDKSKFQIQTK